MIDREQADFKTAKRYGVFCAIAITVFALTVFTLNLGVFGKSVVSKLLFPFFSVLKSTSRFGSLEHMEAIIISLWGVTDFALLGGLMFSSFCVFGRVFKSKDSRVNLLCIVLPTLSFLICVALSKVLFDAELINREIVTWINLVLGVAVPVIVWIIVMLKNSRKNLRV
jgi:hypothetical protein